MPKWTPCHACNRGGNGNDKDKCACGWQRTEPSDLGCYCGAEIVGEIQPRPKLTKGQRKYRKWLSISDCYPDLTFRQFLTMPEFGRSRREAINA